MKSGKTKKLKEIFINEYKCGRKKVIHQWHYTSKRKAEKARNKSAFYHRTVMFREVRQ